MTLQRTSRFASPRDCTRPPGWLLFARDLGQHWVQTAKRQRLWIGLGSIILLGLSLFPVRSIGRQIFRAAGWLLVANDPLSPVDVIVITLDIDGAGVLEAADLVHSGLAARVAVFADSPDPVIEREFIRRGVPYEDMAAQDIRELTDLGITDAQQIPRNVAGTEDEGPALANWCEQHRYRSVLVVSASDHSRRLRRVLHRALKGHRIKVKICSTPYSEFNSDRWWQTHDGIRTEIVEAEKLLLDLVRHPIS